jgi:hypothetical protein
MRVGTSTQQPSERLLYSIDYAEALPDGDLLMVATATTAPATLTVEDPFTADTRVRFWVSGGTAGISYKVELTVTTVAGRIFQDEVTIRVKEL